MTVPKVWRICSPRRLESGRGEEVQRSEAFNHQMQPRQRIQNRKYQTPIVEERQGDMTTANSTKDKRRRK